MKAIVQSVKNASCTVDGLVTGSIEHGLLIYFGCDKDDDISMVEPFLDKIVAIRIFKDQNYKSNLSLKDVNGAILFISQFTLAADLRHGHRPSFDSAMKGEDAKLFYEKGSEYLRALGYKTELGVFGAHMEIQYLNDGPQTYIFDSRDFHLKK